MPQVMFFESIYILWALDTKTCIQQGDLFYPAGLHRNHVLATASTGEIRRGFGKNVGEWTKRVEIGSKTCVIVFLGLRSETVDRI